MKTFLHVGLPKTATTSLQDGLFEPHSQILHLINTRRDPEAQNILNPLKSQDELDYDFNGMQKQLVNFVNQRKKSHHRVFVLSDEFMTVTWHRYVSLQGRAVLARRLLELFPDGHVLLTVRNPIEALASYYIQWIVSFGNAGFKQESYEEWIRTRLDNPATLELSLFDLKKVYDLCAETFGKDKISVLSELQRLTTNTRVLRV